MVEKLADKTISTGSDAGGTDIPLLSELLDEAIEYEATATTTTEAVLEPAE